jgi:hypothetical protein
MKRLIVTGWALALVLAACAGDREAITEEFLPGTESTTTTIGSGPVATTTATTTPAPATVESLIEGVRAIREIDFASPSVAYGSEAEVQAGYHRLHGVPRTGNDAFDLAYFQMLGVVDGGESLAALHDPCPVPGYYDPESGVLVLVDGISELTPLDRKQLFTEITSLATDAAYKWFDVLETRHGLGDSDGAAALWGLVRGDAVFHADRYAAEVLTSTDRFAITLEEISCRREQSEPSPFVSELEAFRLEVGPDFVEELIAGGGLDALNAAYRRPPASTEQVYHPARYAARETAIPVDLGAISVSGFTEADAGGFGELIFRAVLAEGIGSAQALQAATGWGGDTYRVLWNGSDVVLVAAFEGDETRDARELAETLGGWASASLGVGGGRPDNTGLAFEGEDYAFVAHDDASMLLVVSNDAEAGRDVRDTFWPEW